MAAVRCMHNEIGRRAVRAATHRSRPHTGMEVALTEGRMTADQKGHVAKRQAAAPPLSVGNDIKLPGGNAISRDRVPILTMAPPNGLRTMGGSAWPEFNDTLLKSTVATLSNTDPDAVPQRVAAVSAALAAFRPADELEGMIASQCVALHFAAMECLRRAILPGQTFEVASKLRKDAANMARAMTDMLDAMDRKRGRGPQVVRVERVVVHEGGRAIVGNVQGGDTAAMTKPAPPLAIGQEQSGLTLDDLIGKQPELVGEGGV
jgi:hypothetical protein